MSKKWDNINSIVKVNTKKDFKDKIDKRYGKIIVYGDLKEEIMAYVNAKNIGLVAAFPMALMGAFFWPACVIGGGLIAANMDLMSYQLENKSGEFVFMHKKFLKKK